MATFTDKKFEVMYQDFRNVHAEWETLVSDCVIFSDVDTRDLPFRSVGLTADPAVLEKAEHLVSEWQRFATAFDKQGQGSKSTILKETYMPVPYILKVKHEVEILRRGAMTSFVHPRESILTRYDSTIAKFGKMKAAASFIKLLKNERDFFESEPEGTLYRLRSSGFTEITLVHTPAADLAPVRSLVGAHGALIFSTSLTKDDVQLRDITGGDQKSMYDRITRIECSVLEQGDLYRVSDIEFERKYREVYRSVQRNDTSMRINWEKREREMRVKYRGTEKYNKFISDNNAMRPIRKWVLEHDYILIERMRDIGEFETKSVVDIRARYLYDDEMKAGHYSSKVIARRQEMIDQGITLYQDLYPKSK